MQTKLEKTMSPRGQIGVTLIELLVVVVILAIITAVSYPSYVQYIVDAKRTAATSVLLQVADKQQQFFMDNKSYSADLTNLGFPSNPQEISDDGQVMATGISQNVYSVALSNVAATTYTITATPLNSQLSRDAECGALTLNQSGARGAGGDVGDCWR